MVNNNNRDSRHYGLTGLAAAMGPTYGTTIFMVTMLQKHHAAALYALVKVMIARKVKEDSACLVNNQFETTPSPNYTNLTLTFITCENLYVQTYTEAFVSQVYCHSSTQSCSQ